MAAESARERKRTVILAAIVMAGIMATAQGAVVLRNASWATRNVLTNGMGAAHGSLPANTTNFTVEAWVKPRLVAASSTRTYKAHYILSVMGGGGAAENMLLVLNSNNTDGHFRMYYGNNGWSPDTVIVPGDQWTHVAVSKTKDSARFFTNGVFACSWEDNRLTSALHTSYLPGIGCERTGVRNSTAESDANNYVFQGSLSDVRLWTTARTDAEIAANYATRLTGAEEGLFLYVPFNDGTIGESVVKNLADGHDLTVPPTQELAWDSELDEKFGAVGAFPPCGTNHTAILESKSVAGKGIQTDIRISTRTYTVETWARIDSTNRHSYLLGQYVNGTWWVGLDLPQNYVRPRLRIGSSNALLSDTEIRLGEWFHIAGTLDEAGIAKLYINGAEVGRIDKSDADIPPDVALELFNTGAKSNGNTSILGSLRETRVWNCARSATEIAGYMNVSATGDESGLIGCWALDEGTGTTVSNKVTGVLSSFGDAVSNFSWNPPLSTNSALYAADNTANSLGRIVTDAKITAADFTVETWICLPYVLTAGRYVMGQYYTNNKDSWITLYVRANNVLLFQIGSSGNAALTQLAAPQAIAPNIWYHVAVTRSGSDLTMYIDGENVRSMTANTTAIPNNASFTLFTTGGNSTFPGYLREARIWNVARSQSEIRAAMLTQASGTESGLAGCWPLDEGSGRTVVNKVTGNTSTVPSGLTWKDTGFAPALQHEDSSIALAPEFGGSWFGVVRTEKAIDVQDFTFETWVRPTAMHNRQTFLFSQWARGENDANNPNRFLMGFDNTDHFGFFISGTDGMGNRGGWQRTDETVPLNAWTHLAATRQGSTLRFYINGQRANIWEFYDEAGNLAGTKDFDTH